MTGSVSEIVELGKHVLLSSDAFLINLFHFFLNLFFHLFLVILSL
jgi:hypothetical protein